MSNGEGAFVRRKRSRWCPIIPTAALSAGCVPVYLPAHDVTVLKPSPDLRSPAARFAGARADSVEFQNHGECVRLRSVPGNESTSRADDLSVCFEPPGVAIYGRNLLGGREPYPNCKSDVQQEVRRWQLTFPVTIEGPVASIEQATGTLEDGERRLVAKARSRYIFELNQPANKPVSAIFEFDDRCSLNASYRLTLHGIESHGQTIDGPSILFKSQTYRVGGHWGFIGE
jgi:hypothetical protein